LGRCPSRDTQLSTCSVVEAGEGGSHGIPNQPASLGDKSKVSGALSQGLTVDPLALPKGNHARPLSPLAGHTSPSGQDGQAGVTNRFYVNPQPMAAQHQCVCHCPQHLVYQHNFPTNQMLNHAPVIFPHHTTTFPGQHSYPPFQQGQSVAPVAPVPPIDASVENITGVRSSSAIRPLLLLHWLFIALSSIKLVMGLLLSI
jgi:hypothetical protein